MRTGGIHVLGRSFLLPRYSVVSQPSPRSLHDSDELTLEASTPSALLFNDESAYCNSASSAEPYLDMP